jgi:hypothetical protein
MQNPIIHTGLTDAIAQGARLGLASQQQRIHEEDLLRQSDEFQQRMALEDQQLRALEEYRAIQIGQDEAQLGQAQQRIDLDREQFDYGRAATAGENDAVTLAAANYGLFEGVDPTSGASFSDLNQMQNFRGLPQESQRRLLGFAIDTHAKKIGVEREVEKLVKTTEALQKNGRMPAKVIAPILRAALAQASPEAQQAYLQRMAAAGGTATAPGATGPAEIGGVPVDQDMMGGGGAAPMDFDGTLGGIPSEVFMGDAEYKAALEAQARGERIRQGSADLAGVGVNYDPARAEAAIRLRENGYPVSLGEANLSGRQGGTDYKNDPEYQYLNTRAELTAQLAGKLNSISPEYKRAAQDAERAAAELTAYFGKRAGRSQAGAKQLPASAVMAALDDFEATNRRPPNEQEMDALERQIEAQLGGGRPQP